MSNPQTTEEKAFQHLAGWVENVIRGDDYASDLTAWVIKNLKPSAVKGLAADFDQAEENKW